MTQKGDDGIYQVTWKEVCGHVKKIEEANFESDCILDELRLCESESYVNIYESVDDLGCAPLT